VVRIKLSIVAFALVFASAALAANLEVHFFGHSPSCYRQQPVPTLIVADVTRMGEIDDSISLFMYSKLEELGCVKVIGIVSIFGNGGSSTDEVHSNLLSRLKDMKLGAWPVYHGPMKRMSFEHHLKLDETDTKLLTEIATIIKLHKKVVIAELGPATVSASILKSGFITGDDLIKILTVGGRSEGEQFSVNPLLPFAFRDMNVAEDRMAIKYLIDYHSNLIWTVTYRTGLGARMLSPQMVSDIGSEELTTHAYKRANKLKTIGYQGLLPLWDAWTTNWFIEGRSDYLGCKATYAKMQYASTGFKPSDSMQLVLDSNRTNTTKRIEACHEVMK
jgi:hypothetical protein